MLYVVDSVTRKWLEQAKQQGQLVSSAAPDGTFAAGVNRVTELMPILMNDITSFAPQDQKVCLDVPRNITTFLRAIHRGREITVRQRGHLAVHKCCRP